MFWKQNVEPGQPCEIAWVVGGNHLCTLRTLVEFLNMLCYTLKGNVSLLYDYRKIKIKPRGAILS